MGVFTHGELRQAQAQAVPEFWAMLPSTLQGLWVLSASYHCWGPAGDMGTGSHQALQKHCASSEPLHPSSTSSTWRPATARTSFLPQQYLTDPPMKCEQGGAWDVLAKHRVSKEDDFPVPASYHIVWGHNKVSLLQDI